MTPVASQPIHQDAMRELLVEGLAQAGDTALPTVGLRRRLKVMLGFFTL